jgi:hypothetical protein
VEKKAQQAARERAPKSHDPGKKTRSSLLNIASTAITASGDLFPASRFYARRLNL